MLDDLRLFVITVEAGSLTAAAARLATTVATVSRRLSALEQQLGRKLVHRSPRGLALTRDGEAYFNECSEWIRVLEDKLTELDASLNSLAGRLRVLVPTNLATGPLAEFWPRFIRSYPQIQLRVDASNDFVDMRQTQADVAIRIGVLEDSTLIQKRIGTIATLLIGAGGKWLPGSVEELEHIPSVASDPLTHWQLRHAGGEHRTLAKLHNYTTNNLALVTSMVKSGEAISLVPESEVYQDIQAGELVNLLPEWRGQDRPVYLVWPERKSVSVRMQAFTGALVQYLAQQPWFTPGSPGPGPNRPPARGARMD